jgi:hypothetical protein
LRILIHDYHHPRLNCELRLCMFLSVFLCVLWFEAITCYVVSSNQVYFGTIILGFDSVIWPKKILDIWCSQVSGEIGDKCHCPFWNFSYLYDFYLWTPYVFTGVLICMIFTYNSSFVNRETLYPFCSELRVLLFKRLDRMDKNRECL